MSVPLKDIDLSFFYSMGLGGTALELENAYPLLKWVQSKMSLSAIHDGEVLFSVMITPAQIDFLMDPGESAGTPEYLSLKSSLFAAMEGAIVSAPEAKSKNTQKEADFGVSLGEILADALSVKKKDQVMKVAIYGQKLNGHSSGEEFVKCLNNLTVATKPLMEAEYLMQPVSGTSKTSRYYCVMLSSTVRMAIRIQGSSPYNLAIRLEGYGPNVKQMLKESGFFSGEGSIGTSHASIHLSVSSMADIVKAIGAIYALCATQVTVSPMVPGNWLMEIMP